MLPLLLGLLLMSAPLDDATHREEVDTWHAGRVERLHNPDGWLTLVGLYRLDEGANSFGSADDNLLVFPASAPAHAGTIHVADGQATLEVADGVTITVDGEAPPTGPLGKDVDETTHVLEMGSYRFYVIERNGELLLRVRDHESPVLEEFTGVDRFPVDRKWRVIARVVPYEEPKPVSIPNVLGTTSVEMVPAALMFQLEGREFRLDPIDSGDDYWLIFSDNTNGPETYGGGRFLYSEEKRDDGTVVIDFNKAYNPPCIFTPYATCPLPPEGNHLDLDLRAGEKNWGDAAH